MQQRLPSTLDPPILFAHRGARAHAPENTLEAFELALRLGATGLESDVWLTADGVPVLDHDGVVGRRPRRRPLRRVGRAQLPAHIPTLAELFTECGSDYELSLDVKDPAAAGPVLDVVRQHASSMVSRLWLCHHDTEYLSSLRTADGDVRLIHSTRLHRLPNGPEQAAARLRSLRIDGINLHHSDWTGGLVTLFHRFEVLTFGWDLQFDHVLRPALRMGLDAVYSDHVDVMVDSYRAERHRA